VPGFFGTTYLYFVGFVVDYISHPVINSFTTAAAITIACSQLKVGLVSLFDRVIGLLTWLGE